MNEILKSLWDTRQTVLEMARDRKYKLIENNIIQKRKCKECKIKECNCIVICKHCEKLECDCNKENEEAPLKKVLRRNCKECKIKKCDCKEKNSYEAYIDFSDFYKQYKNEYVETIKDKLQLKFHGKAASSNIKEGKKERVILALWTPWPNICNDSKKATSIIDVYNKCLENKAEHAIIIYQGKITPTAKLYIKNLSNQNLKIELYLENVIRVNPIKHSLVPKHILCSNKTKINLLKEYSISLSQLPGIKTTDPIAIYFEAKKGNIFKIIRLNESMPYIDIDGVKIPQYYISYRLVT
jgi:DNA-directed RNA polymerase subunit H (RpoH/RPB5)